MFHSSFIPIALPSSLLVSGLIWYALKLIGVSDHDTLVFTLWGGGLINVAIGLPKNIYLGDFLSLLVVRPISLLVTVYGTYLVYAICHHLPWF